jgi:hypothetical protein
MMKNRTELVKSNTIFNGLAIGVSLVLLFILLLRFISIPHFSAFHEDETIYYSGAKVFAEANSVKARGVISENVSTFFEADWYGIFYPIFFGGIMKITGTSYKAFITINILLYLLIAVIILKSKQLDRNERLSLLAITVASPVLLKYAFYFMPMVLNVLFALVLIFYLLKVNAASATMNRKDLNAAIFKYVLLVLLFSLFRVTYVFWVIGIVPFSTSRKNGISLTVVCFVTVLLIVLYMKFFNAPAYAPNVAVISYLFQHDFYLFFKSVIHSIISNIEAGPLNFKTVSKPYILPYYFTLLAPFYLVYRYAVKQKNKLLLALSAICLLSNLVSLFFYYLAYGLYMRFSIQLFTTLCFVVIMDKTISNILKQSFILLLLLSSALAIPEQLIEFDQRELSGVTLQNEFYSAIADLKNNIANQPVTTILVDRTLFVSHPSKEFELAVPYIAANGGTIRYTYNIREKDPLTLHQKLKINYVLSVDSLKSPNLTPIYFNKHYFLYKLR